MAGRLRGQGGEGIGIVLKINDLWRGCKVASAVMSRYKQSEDLKETTMSLRARLQEATVAAMKAKDAARLSALRMVSSSIKDREIAVRAEAGEVTDGDILALLGKMVKQRTESARAFADGGRAELADKELAEIKVIEEFLPRQMDSAEVEAAIAAAIAEAGASSIKDMGKVMAVLKAAYTGQMDFGAVGAVLKTKLG